MIYLVDFSTTKIGLPTWNGCFRGYPWRNWALFPF